MLQLRGRSWKEWAGIVVFVAGSLGLLRILSAHNESNLEPRKPPQVAEVVPGALTKYTEDAYPRTYAAWGREGIARISEMERLAADHVARSGKCSRVDMVTYSEKRSRPQHKIVVFVDCGKRRFYVSEPELQKPPESIQYQNI